MQNLIICELQDSQSQAEKIQDKAILKECKGKIKSMYRLFFNNDNFEKFIIKDVMNRGIETITYIKSNPETVDLGKISLDKLLKEDKISDLMVLSFLTE